MFVVLIKIVFSGFCLWNNVNNNIKIICISSFYYSSYLLNLVNLGNKKYEK